MDELEGIFWIEEAFVTLKLKLQYAERKKNVIEEFEKE